MTNIPTEGSRSTPPSRRQQLSKRTKSRVFLSPHVEVLQPRLVLSAAPLGQPEFFKGINFNGDSVAIGGNQWLGQTDAERDGLTFSASYDRGSTLAIPAPLVGAEMAHMLRSRISASSADIFFSQALPDGEYDIQFWTMEYVQSHSRSMEILLEGQSAASGVGFLGLTGWEALAVESVRVDDGQLDVQIRATESTAHLMGMTIFRHLDAPRVALETTASTTEFTTEDSIELVANVIDPAGEVATVEFFANSSPLGMDSAEPYTFTWSEPPAGNHQLTVLALTHDGTAVPSTPLAVTVHEVVPPPVGGGSFVKGINFGGDGVLIEGNQWLGQTDAEAAGLAFADAVDSITATIIPTPLPGADTARALLTGVRSSNGDLSLSQTVANGDYDVYLWMLETSESNARRMELEIEEQATPELIGDLPLSGWDIYLIPAVVVQDGQLDVVLHATRGTAQLMGMAIFTSLAQPTVDLTIATGETEFIAGDIVPLVALAEDHDGSISKVEFFAGATALGEATSQPYEFNWQTVAAGSYQLTARATDDDGRVAFSQAVTAVVAPRPATGVELLGEPDSRTVSSGSIIEFEARGTGGTGEYEYRFWMRGGSGEWQSMRYFATEPTWQLNTAGLAAGQHHIQVFVRTAGADEHSAVSTPYLLYVDSGDEVSREIHVAPKASDLRDGSEEYPYSLTDVVVQDSDLVNPGDVIWLHGGVYEPRDGGAFDFYVNGTPERPVLIIADPSERVTFDGGFRVHGTHTIYSGLEITDFDSTHFDSRGGSQEFGETRSTFGLDVRGTGNQFINNYVHETAQGMFAGRDAGDMLVYGNVFFNNGWLAPDRLHGHGVYTQNAADTRKEFQANIFTRNFGNGFQLFGSAATDLENVHLTDNVVIKDRFLFGGGAPLDNVSIQRTLTYDTRRTTNPQNEFGFGIPEIDGAEDLRNFNVSITDNYLMGGAQVRWMVEGLVFTGNTVVKPAFLGHPLIVAVNQFSKDLTNLDEPDPFAIDHNSYFGSSGGGVVQEIVLPDVRGAFHEFAAWQAASGYDLNSTWSDPLPSGLDIFARANRFETGRGYVTVYNWDDFDLQPGRLVQHEVASGVDITHFGLTDGDEIEIRNAEDPLGRAVTMTVRQNSHGRILVDLPLIGWEVDPPNNYEQLIESEEGRVALENGELIPEPTGPAFNTLLIQKANRTVSDLALLQLRSESSDSQKPTSGSTVRERPANLAVADADRSSLPAMLENKPNFAKPVAKKQAVDAFAEHGVAGAPSWWGIPESSPETPAPPEASEGEPPGELLAAIEDLLAHWPNP